MNKKLSGRLKSLPFNFYLIYKEPTPLASCKNQSAQQYKIQCFKVSKYLNSIFVLNNTLEFFRIIEQFV
jgi:hypothetical protein